MRNKWLASIAIILALSSISLIAYATKLSDDNKNMGIELESVYEKAFIETTQLLTDVEVKLEKLLVVDDPELSMTLLSNISRMADAAQDNIASLPVSPEQVAGTMKFINQIGDYCRTLYEKMAMGNEMTDAELSQLAILYEQCVQLNIRLAEMQLQGLEDTEENITTVTSKLPINQLEHEGVEYPTLLYDGPFSDGEQIGNFASLGENEVTQEDALKAAAIASGNANAQVKVTGESMLPVAGWEIEAMTADGTLDLFVTRRGGKVLSMLPNFAGGIVNVDYNTCLNKSLEFLKNQGFADMEPSYWQLYSGVLVINFAAKVDGVIIYPDMVKVQCNTETGNVIGIEAHNYYRNHVQREMLTPSISEDEVRAKTSDRLNIDTIRRCIIPFNTKERQAYEVKGTMNGTTFLIYVDITTGKEIDVLKLVEDDEGQLTI